jgi:hypothetical protein
MTTPPLDVCCRHARLRFAHFVAHPLFSVQCMFYPSLEESKVEFVHVCRSRHEEATMIIVDNW